MQARPPACEMTEAPLKVVVMMRLKSCCTRGAVSKLEGCWDDRPAQAHTGEASVLAEGARLHGHLICPCTVRQKANSNACEKAVRVCSTPCDKANSEVCAMQVYMLTVYKWCGVMIWVLGEYSYLRIVLFSSNTACFETAV